MKRIGLLLVFASALSFAQQSTAPAQRTEVPPTPTCNPRNIFTGTDCQDRINLYNQAVEQRRSEEVQLYADRQKAQATAPLQLQIADQQAQIKKLQEQMPAARDESFQNGALIGAGAMLVLFAMAFGIWKLTQSFSVTKKAQSSAASA